MIYNLYNRVADNPGMFRQLSCDESLITIFNCPLDNKLQDTWSHHNYIVYVMEGRKIWHTSDGSFDLRPPSCVFIRKGASIIEQFFDTRFCFITFFIPDEFLVEVLKSKSNPVYNTQVKHKPVIPIAPSAATDGFFQSMMPYFEAGREPDKALLQLKFRELILSIADNPDNQELISYFGSLLKEPHTVSFQRVMEDNFCYNLKMEDYAKLTLRSVSAFKRDFLKIYHTTPGKWLLEKRLDYSLHLLKNHGKSVADAAFESGFENTSHFSRSFRVRFGKPPASIKQKVPL